MISVSVRKNVPAQMVQIDEAIASALVASIKSAVCYTLATTVVVIIRRGIHIWKKGVW